MSLLLDVRQLQMRLPQVSCPILHSVSFSIQRGQTVALVGQSGSGKSITAFSILKLLPQALYPKGEILFYGRDLLKFSPRQLCQVRGQRIGMIFQEPMTALNPLRTIFQHIYDPIKLHHYPTIKSARDYVVSLLELVEFPEGKDRLHAYPHQLSGGQRQRVMIAMAIACYPDLLIADEPTTALDVTLQKELLTTLRKIQKKQNMGLLLISHDLEIVQHWADHVVIMQQGRILEKGVAHAIMRKPVEPYTKKLIESIPNEKNSAFVGNAPTLLKINGLNVAMEKKNAWWKKERVHLLRDIHFDIRQGETIGVVGESGAGKSMLALAILRLVKASGDITFLDKNLLKLSPSHMRALRRHIQMIFQDPFHSLNPRMSVQQIIEEGLNVHRLLSHRNEKERRVCEVLEQVGLDSDMRLRYSFELSGGQRQRVAIARAIILQPQLLILDEPTSALDLVVQSEILALLKDLQAKQNMAYIFISHDLRVVRALSHRIMVMRQGHILEFEESQQIFDNPQHAYTKTLLEASFHKAPHNA